MTVPREVAEGEQIKLTSFSPAKVGGCMMLINAPRQ